MTPASACARLDQLVGLGVSGAVVVVVPPGEQPRHAATFADGAERAVRTLDEVAAVEGARVQVVPGLLRDTKDSPAALERFNGRRDLLTAARRIVVLVLSRREFAEARRYAADVCSALLFVVEVDFDPDPAVDADAARKELARWQRERFGRLDLRGFVRAEGEDVAWRIEDIYQDIKASPMDLRDGEAPHASGYQSQSVTGWLRHDSSFVILGHPGSGKTFFLRWLAISMAARSEFAGIKRPLPLLVSLAAYAESPGPVSLYDYIIEALLEAEQPAAHIIHAEVNAARAVFLLDGLDEVGDESARRRVAAAVGALRSDAQGCLVVVTSRIAGYDPSVLCDALRLVLEPFDDNTVRGFLLRWCELYALERLGDSSYARQEGRTEGERLARDVLEHPDVSELARSPLLLTVLAVVHRAGVRLPEHRVELYEHATRVLVERWNRVRSLSAPRPPPPLKAADAVRLLGPIALTMVTADVHGVITEEVLRRMLGQALAGGVSRGLTTADEAITLFRNALGLLVEQGPGVYAFVHLTLAEYFAAWELVRSHELEKLTQKAKAAFRPEWREVILLAAGVLGVIRADDARLEALVDRLIDRAARLPGRPSPKVPSLLAGLLSDDPGLSQASVEKLARCLVPGWWFGREYGVTLSFEMVLGEASRLMRGQAHRGRVFETLQKELRHWYGQGPEERVVQNLQRGGSYLVLLFLRFLEDADLDLGPWLHHVGTRPSGRFLERLYETPVPEARVVGHGIEVGAFLSRWIDAQVRVGALSVALVGRFHEMPGGPTIYYGRCDWRDAQPTGESSDGYLKLKFLLKFPDGANIGGESRRVAGGVWVEFA